MVSPRLFDRLATTETFASAKMKGKVKEQKRSSSTPRKTSMAFFARLAYTETFASAQMKGLIDASDVAKKKGEKSPRSSSRTRSVMSTRSEARGESFWDRLSKTETYASLTYKGKAVVRQGYDSPHPRSSPRHWDSKSVRSVASSTTGVKSVSSRSRTSRGASSELLFDRLAKVETLGMIQRKKQLQERSSQASQVQSQSDLRSKPQFKPQVHASFSQSYRSTVFDAKKVPPRRPPTIVKSSYPVSPTKVAPPNRSSPRSVSRTSRSPSSRSVGTARTATKSVATTRSVTTSRSLGNSTIQTVNTVRSLNSIRSSPSSNVAGAGAGAGRGVTPGRVLPKTAAVSYPSNTQRRLPPPSPKPRTTALSTGFQGKPLTRDKSTSPKSLSQSVRQKQHAASTFASRSSKNFKPSTTAKSAMGVRAVGAVPQKPTPPPPPPRPVLQFDDDDDELSFGSEGSDEASLGPSSTRAPQDAGSVASKSIASKSIASKRSTGSAIAGLTAATAAEMASNLSGKVYTDDFVSDGVDNYASGQDEKITAATSEYASRHEGIRDDEQDSMEEDGLENVHPTESMEYQQERYDGEEEEDEENIDDYLDSIDKRSDDERYMQDHESHLPETPSAEAESVKSQPKSNIRVAVVHESDDELSFGSDEEGEDDEHDKSNDVQHISQEFDHGDDHDFERVNDAHQENYDTEPNKSFDSYNEEEPETNEITVQSESIEVNVAPDAADASLVAKESETDMQDLEAETEEQVPSDREEESCTDSIEADDAPMNGDVDPVDYEHDDDDLDYDDMDNAEEDYEEEDYDEAQRIEEEYDEEDDLGQMDSLDLILDATNSKDSKYERQTHIVEEENDFDNKLVNGSENSQSKYKIFKTEKYHPEYGVEEVHPDDLYLKETLECFERGEISNQEIAVLIIEALFERDFNHGEHWEIDDGMARELEEDEGGGGDLKGRAFVVKRQARLDWNDLYSVAASKGTIVIVPESNEIRVENYSYFVAGDRKSVV